MFLFTYHTPETRQYAAEDYDVRTLSMFSELRLYSYIKKQQKCKYHQTSDKLRLLQHSTDHVIILICITAIHILNFNDLNQQECQQIKNVPLGERCSSNKDTHRVQGSRLSITTKFSFILIQL